MKIFSPICFALLCGALLIAPTVKVAGAQDAPLATTAAPPTLEQLMAKLLDPHAEVTKSIAPTEIQKNLLENASAGAGLDVKDAIRALEVFSNTLAVNTSLSPKFLPRKQAIQQMPLGEKRDVARKAFLDDIIKEIRPQIEKETHTALREAILKFFKRAAEIPTEAQMPKFKEAQTRVERSLDKDLPAVVKAVAQKLIEGR
jgi:hypothetical protein